MEPEDAFPIRDPYRFRVKLGDVIRLSNGRMGVIVEVHLVGVPWWKNLFRHFTDQDRYFDREIDELTLVS